MYVYHDYIYDKMLYVHTDGGCELELVCTIVYSF